MKAEKRNSGAEKKIENIQAICLSEKSTECICPKCGTHHRAKMLWAGRGMPRKFCPTCKHYSQSLAETDPFVVSNVAGTMKSYSI